MDAPLPSLEKDSIRVGVGSWIPAQLLEFGIDPHEMISRCGVDPDRFADPDNRIGYSDLANLLSACSLETGCETFGLLVGSRARLEMLGYLGQEMRKVEMLGEALAVASKALSSYDRGAVLEIATAQDVVQLRYIVTSPFVRTSEQIVDAALAVVVSVISELCGEGWKPLKVMLPRRAPGNVEPFQRVFSSPVQFNQPFGSVLLDRAWLSAPIRDAVRGALRELAPEQPLDFDDRVIAACVKQLLESRVVSAEKIAAQFGVGRRTLHRWLAGCGTNFNETLKRARFAYAGRLLLDTDRSATDIATAIGYSELAAFTRAFQDWCGKTPSEYRRKKDEV